MTHHAKASSAGSTQATGNSRGLFRRALATRVISRDAKGSGAPSSRRLRATLAVLALATAAFAVTAAPASAANTAQVTSITNVSYASARVKGKVTAPGFDGYTFQYSTDGISWAESPLVVVNGVVDKEVETELTGLKGGTQYFTRLKFFLGGETSPEPNLSFTTLPVDPPSVIATDNASAVSYTTATFSGEVSRPATPAKPKHGVNAAYDVNCQFQYLTDAAYQENLANTAPAYQGATSIPCEPENPIHKAGPEKVEARATGLSSNTTYHVRLFASNASPITDAKEAPQTFITQQVTPPTVVSTEPATDVEYTQASVKGVVERPAVSDHAFDASCNFEYVTDEQFNASPGEEFAAANPAPCEGTNPIEAQGQSTVEATLPNLAPQTTYHFRLSASNQGGSDSKAQAATFTTTGPVPAPSVIAVADATDIDKRSAHVSGEVERPEGQDPALDSYCRFEYVTDAQFDENEANSLPPFEGAAQTECLENPVQAADSPTVEASVSGLEPSTEYHYRLIAENAGGTDAKAAGNTFTTLAVIPATLTVDSITDVDYLSAHVTGTVDPGNQGVRWAFEYSPAGQGEWSGGVQSSYGHTTFSPESASMDIPCLPETTDSPFFFCRKLKPGTTYEVRLGGLNYEDQEKFFTSEAPPYQKFTTKGTSTPPLATLDPVTAITAHAAHFSGTVDSNAPSEPLPPAAEDAYETDYHFECTPSCSPSEGLVKTEEGARAISIDTPGLQANTHYEVKLVAHNVLGTTESNVQTFDTPFVVPDVETGPGASDGNGGYILEGVVDPNNSEVTDCYFEYGPNATYPNTYKAACLPAPGNAKTTVEARLESLNVGSTYHFELFATNAGGTTHTADRTFIPTSAPKHGECPNETLREENSSLALPECRAYEMVTDPHKQGQGAFLEDFDAGDAVRYRSNAPNLADSGQGRLENTYVTLRTPGGWQTIPNLNGPSGSFFGPPENITEAFLAPMASADLFSSIYALHKEGGGLGAYLRRPDGSFELIGAGSPEAACGCASITYFAASNDLSHLLLSSQVSPSYTTSWGPGVYEFVGTGNDLPRRVDLDNNNAPICSAVAGRVAAANAISADGSVIYFTSERCGPNQLWARVGGTVSFHVSASECTRLDCNAPADASFSGAARDGSRVFFTTTQQLVDGDHDQTNDLYACDIPTAPQAPVGDANSCSALHLASGARPEAKVESVLAISDDGSTVYFTAKGVLADNRDALGEAAQAGDHNLYVWRSDPAHPGGQTTFLARLDSNDLQSYPDPREPKDRTLDAGVQTTSDGRYLVFTTDSQLVSTDTDNARDVYRYDAATDELTRVSTKSSGTGGNGELDATIRAATPHNSHPAISEDGQKVVFTTAEPLAPVDGNGASDVYLWTPGAVSLTTTGSANGGSYDARATGLPPGAVIDGSGDNIYFETGGALTPADNDSARDVYDARIDGGFGFTHSSCTAEACQPPAVITPGPGVPDSQQTRPGNAPVSKPCSKGTVKKHGKCVKAPKKHSAKKHHPRKTGHNNGGAK